MMHAILIFITAIYYTLPKLMTAPTVINRLIIISPCARSLKENVKAYRRPVETIRVG